MDAMDKMTSLTSKTVLVTGGAGFLGSHVCENLLKNNAKVICFDDLSTGTKENIRSFTGSGFFRFVPGDANKLSDLKKVFESEPIDYVFHYAARVGVQRTYEKPLEVLRDIEGFKNILELSRKNKVKKVMFASSSEVYGEPTELPEREEGILNPRTPYGAVKLIGEHYMRTYFQIYGLKTCSLRFFNVYGPRQDSSSYGFVAGIFLRQALSGRPITVFGDGLQTRDFVYVEDNVKASIAALLSDNTNGQTMNIGIGKSVTILELARKVVLLCGTPGLEIKFFPQGPGDVIRHRNPEVLRMQKLIGYEPKHSLDDGLTKTFAWYKERIERGEA